MKPLRLLVPLLVAGCTAAPEAPAARGASPLEGQFAAAAREYQVPVGVLKAVAYVETRLTVPGAPSTAGGHGLMQLAARGDWDVLGRAAALTGASRAQLEVDPAANLRGAAAVLRELFDRAARDDASLSAAQAGDWYPAVALYPGIESATLAQDYATDVFQRLEAGFELDRGGPVTLAPTASRWQRHAPQRAARRDALGDYPASAAYVQSPNYNAGRSSYEFVVIHTMQGSYAGTRSWFQNPAAQVSSQYIVRSSDGQITQMVSDGDTAWHAQCYNARSIGIEHEGYVQDPATWYTDAMYTESAKLTRWLCDRHGIPKDRTHLIGHYEVAPSCNTGGHTDPGSGWNWTRYLQLVLNQVPGSTTGVLIGAIYEGGNAANRVAGATVTVNGQSVTTAADGLYQFTLAPGSYTAAVSKAGYGGASVTRTVTAGAQVWGSMEINPVQATGTLRGKVFVYNAANPSDMSVAVPNATVTAGGQSAQSAADGQWSFTLAPGTYTVQVSAAGYQSNQVTRTVTSGTTSWGSVGLTAAGGADTQAPQVAISFPQDGASLDLAVFNVAGTASDNAGPVASVALSLNGGAATSVPVTGGSFSVAVQLAPGANALEVKATDAAGNVGAVRAAATFNAGVGGAVHVAGDETARLAGAAVTLLDRGTGATVGTATSDATGAFGLAVTAVPADYVLVVKAPGYRSSSQTVTVPDDRRLLVKVGLQPGQDAPTELAVTFLEPLDGATLTTDTVTVYGTVQGFVLAGVTVNGGAAELLGDGGFSATVHLVEGTNVLEAQATGVAGESAAARISVVRKLAGGSIVVKGGCTTGAGLLPLAAVLLLLRRRPRR